MAVLGKLDGHPRFSGAADHRPREAALGAGPDDTTITVKRPLLAELHAAQAQLGAQAGKPITLTETIRILVTTWRDRDPRPAAEGGS